MYSQDSDWNSLLADMSEQAIGREVTLQELEKGFRGSGIDGISIKQLLPKVSMQAFRVKVDTAQWDNWKNVFNEENCKYYVNEEKNILIDLRANLEKDDDFNTNQCGIAILLENNNDYKFYYNAMDKDTQKEFDTYPIINLMNTKKEEL